VEARGYIELVDPKATRGQRMTLRVTSLVDLAPAARPTACASRPARPRRDCWPVARLILAAVPALALVYPIKKWAAAAPMLGAFAYLMISGSSFGTVRSAIMILIMFLAVILHRPALALRNVVLAACLILLLFPESLFDVGFQMSFAAVVALISCSWRTAPVPASSWLRSRAPRAARRPKRSWIFSPRGARARTRFMWR
jgi:predicted membrane metal-binding protein